MEENRRGAETHAKKKGNLERGREMRSSEEKDREQKEGEEEIREGLCSLHFLTPLSFNFRPLTYCLFPTVSICFSSLCISPEFLSVALFARFLRVFFNLSSKPEQLQEAAGAGRTWRGGSQEAFSFTAVENQSPNS